MGYIKCFCRVVSLLGILVEFGNFIKFFILFLNSLGLELSFFKTPFWNFDCFIYFKYLKLLKSRKGENFPSAIDDAIHRGRRKEKT